MYPQCLETPPLTTNVDEGHVRDLSYFLSAGVVCGLGHGHDHTVPKVQHIPFVDMTPILSLSKINSAVNIIYELLSENSDLC